MNLARFSPRACRDLASIHDHIAADEPMAAGRVRSLILETADLLAENPGLGRTIVGAKPRHEAIRWFVVPKCRNYLIFYESYQDTIMVVRVLHAARDWTRFYPPAGRSGI